MIPRSARTITIAIAAAITCIFTAMFLFTPFCLDDYLFRFYWNEAGHSAMHYISMIRFEENGRLGNILFPIFDNTICWSFWKIAFALATSATIIAIALLCHKSIHTNMPAALASTFLMATLLPWRAYMFVSDYFLNYIPGSLMGILLVWLYIYPPKHKHSALCAILAFATGLQHEALTMALFTGIAVIFAFQRFRFTSQQWLMTAALFIAAAIQLSSPGLWLKLGAWEDGASSSTFKDFLLCFPLVIFLLLSLPLLFIPRCRRLLHNRLFLISTAIALTALLMIIPLGVKNIRATWFQQLFAIIPLAQIYLTLINPSKWFGLAIATATVAYWCAIATLQHRFYVVNQAIEAQITDVSPLAYADLPQNKPKWTLLIPQQSLWSDYLQITMANLGDTCMPRAVVPPQLQFFNRSEIHRVDGSAEAIEFRGVYLFPHRRTLMRIDAHGHPVANVIESTHVNLYTETDTSANVPVSLQTIDIPHFGTYNLMRPAHYHYENRYYTGIDTIK